VPRALITGITGQDGRYLAEFLHGRGYDVFGLVAGQANPRGDDVREQFPFVELIGGDLSDLPSLITAVELSQPDEVYNLGAISFVALSFKQPELTANVTGLGVLRMLHAIRVVGGTGPKNSIKFYQASSSEMFGQVRSSPQNEDTPFHPRSPYGVSKVFGHHTTINYRESYDLFACSGILFNHESRRRGLEFVTRKVTNAVARIKLGLQNELALGNLDARRDWGVRRRLRARDVADLQQPEPDDYVIGTGVTHSVRQMVAAAFVAAEIEDWEKYVVVDERYLRPADVEELVADASKARRVLGWEPTVGFDELITGMVRSDLELEQEKVTRHR